MDAVSSCLGSCGVLSAGFLSCRRTIRALVVRIGLSLPNDAFAFAEYRNQGSGGSTQSLSASVGSLCAGGIVFHEIFCRVLANAECRMDKSLRQHIGVCICYVRNDSCAL